MPALHAAQMPAGHTAPYPYPRHFSSNQTTTQHRRFGLPVGYLARRETYSAAIYIYIYVYIYIDICK